MNDEKEKFDFLDSVLRVLGIAGFIGAVLGGFVAAGGDLLYLVHPSEALIVFGTVFFGLLSTYRSGFLRYLPAAIKPKPDASRREISDSWRRYAAAGGGLGVMLCLINSMSSLGHPHKVGLYMAATMSGVVVAILVSQVLFVYLIQSCAPARANA
tara:strand:- start:116 stop:580 length:465 start_codon:yes stop_codon:yes gene_type:complete